jgi:hypothetical protein
MAKGNEFTQVQCLIQSFSSRPAFKRGRVDWETFRNDVTTRLGEKTLSKKEQELAAIWYSVAQPESLRFATNDGVQGNFTDKISLEEEQRQNKKLLDASIDPLVNSIKSLRASKTELTGADEVNLLQKMASDAFHFSIDPSNIKEKRKLLDRFFRQSLSSPMTKWSTWAKDPDEFIRALRYRNEYDRFRFSNPERGQEIAAQIAHEEPFIELRKRDPDFADKVLWLKSRSTDPKQFKFAFTSLLSKMDEHYQRLLKGTQGYSPEVQPVLESVLLRRAYHQSLEQLVGQLGLKTINLDELYGAGRVDGHTFANDLFTNGYVFWDRGLSSTKGLAIEHGKDFHTLQAVLYGLQMDQQFGKGTFAAFYRKIGKPDVIRAGNPKNHDPANMGDRVYYNYGWLHLFDDIDSLPGGKNFSNFSSISTDIGMGFQHLFPLIAD